MGIAALRSVKIYALAAGGIDAVLEIRLFVYHKVGTMMEVWRGGLDAGRMRFEG